jgi:hypothetical protein
MCAAIVFDELAKGGAVDLAEIVMRQGLWKNSAKIALARGIPVDGLNRQRRLANMRFGRRYPEIKGRGRVRLVGWPSTPRGALPMGDVQPLRGLADR